MSSAALNGWSMVPNPSISIVCYSYCTAAGATLSFAIDTLTISGVFSYTSVGVNMEFDITGFINPSIAGTYTFDITSYETTSGTPYGIDTIKNLPVQVVAGVILITKVIPTDSTRIYDYPSSYTFQISSSTSIAPTN